MRGWNWEGRSVAHDDVALVPCRLCGLSVSVLSSFIQNSDNCCCDALEPQYRFSSGGCSEDIHEPRPYPITHRSCGWSVAFAVKVRSGNSDEVPAKHCRRMPRKTRRPRGATETWMVAPKGNKAQCTSACLRDTQSTAHPKRTPTTNHPLPHPHTHTHPHTPPHIPPKTPPDTLPFPPLRLRTQSAHTPAPQPIHPTSCLNTTIPEHAPQTLTIPQPRKWRILPPRSQKSRKHELSPRFSYLKMKNDQKHRCQRGKVRGKNWLTIWLTPVPTSPP